MQFTSDNPAADLSGIINLDKPAGITSANAVARVKHMLPRKAKIGHAGTLDPFATGVLLLLIGKATRCSEALMSSGKQYEAVATFGGTTDTDDIDSPVTPLITPIGATLIASHIPTRQQIDAALTPMHGIIQQRPPKFSALKVGGKRAYALARAGKLESLPPRPVRIDSIVVLEYAWPTLRLRIDCGRGVYIRSIARDLGEALGVGGYLSELRRTRVGTFVIGNTTTLDQLRTEGIARFMNPIPDSFAPS